MFPYFRLYGREWRGGAAGALAPPYLCLYGGVAGALASPSDLSNKSSGR